MPHDKSVLCPVNIAGMPGIVRPATFTPGDVPGLAATLGDLLADRAMRSELAERGRTAVRALTWERTARATVEVYRTLGLNV